MSFQMQQTFPQIVLSSFGECSLTNNIKYLSPAKSRNSKTKILSKSSLVASSTSVGPEMEKFMDGAPPNMRNTDTPDKTHTFPDSYPLATKLK